MPENGDRDGSIRQLEAYLDDHPDSERFAELAEHLVEEGRFEEAVKTCERGIGFHPELAAGHVVYGKALVGMEMLDEGIQAFERACTLRSNDVGLLAEVGKFLVDSGQREAAFPYLEKGKEIDAEDPRIMHLETELGGAVPADHERIETARLDGNGAEPQAEDEPGEPSDPPPEDDQDDDSLRVPTDKISWPAWESQPPPAKDAFASEEDDEDIEQDFEPPTVYSQNPLAAQQGAGDADEKHPPLSEEFEAASTVEVADSEELAKAIERQQQETMTDEQAGLTAEVSEAVNQAAAPPGEPPTMFDPQEPAGASPWAAEDASSPSPPAEPPTMFEGAQAEAADAEPPPTQFTGSPSGAVVSYQHAVDAPAEHFSYLKVFLVLVPFLVVGLALGGWVAYRHIRSEKINSLLDQVLTSISQDTFLGYSDAQSTVTELLELDDENPRGNALAALVATRLHDEYGPNLTLKEEGQRILEQEKTTPQNAVDLLWTRYHLGADEHLESAVKVVQEQLPSDPRLLGLAGEMAAKRGKAKEAADLLERSLNEQPSSVRTLYALAGLELKQGKTKKATEHLERALGAAAGDLQEKGGGPPAAGTVVLRTFRAFARSGRGEGGLRAAARLHQVSDPACPVVPRILRAGGNRHTGRKGAGGQSRRDRNPAAAHRKRPAPGADRKGQAGSQQADRQKGASLTLPGPARRSLGALRPLCQGLERLEQREARHAGETPGASHGCPGPAGSG
jgi:tetratricopeptide (TPR) repeat protein